MQRTHTLRKDLFMAGQRGFTIIELMIALVLSSIAGIAIFMVYTSSTRTFNQQAELVDLEGNLRFAMEQLRRDISRTGYMATLDSATDRNVLSNSLPAGLDPLRGITLANTVAYGAPNNVFAPDDVRLLGYTSGNDFYYIQSIAGTIVTLNNTAPNPFPVSQSDYEEKFAVGKLLRIQDDSGCDQYQPIASVSWLARTVTLANALAIRGTGICGSGTGLMGACQGCLANPVEIVRYRINVGTWGDGTPRHTLVREILTTAGAVLQSVDVAENIVDLQVGFFGDTTVGGVLAGNTPTIASLTPASATFPGSVYSIVVRVTGRTRHEDPALRIANPGGTFNLVAGVATPNAVSFDLQTTVPGLCRTRVLEGTFRVDNYGGV